MMNLYSYSPINATKTVADYVLMIRNGEIVGSVAARKPVAEQAYSILDALTQANPANEQSLQMLAAAFDDMGRANAQIEFAKKVRSDFVDGLSPGMREQVGE